MTTPRDAIAGLSERLRSWGDADLSFLETGGIVPTIQSAWREAATQLDALSARVKELEAKLSASEAGHQRLFDKYQSALKDAASTTPTREAIAAALRETAYKYFGDYEFSTSQWDAVHCLENAAKCFLEAEARATSAEQERDQALACCDSYAAENQRLHDRMEKAKQERDEAYEQAAKAIDAAAKRQRIMEDGAHAFSYSGRGPSYTSSKALERAAEIVRRLAGPDKEGK